MAKQRVQEFGGRNVEGIGEGVGEGSKELQGKDGSRLRWRSPQSSAGFEKRNKKRSGGVLGEGGTVLEMAVTSLYNDVLLDSEKCHE